MVQRWDPFREVVSLRDAVDRLFDESMVVPRAQRGNANGGQGVMTLPLDVQDTSDGYVVKASLPGFKAEEIEVEAHGKTLTIRGERKSEDEKSEQGYLLRERHYGSFYRSIALPEPINADKADSAYEDGVLTLTLPKADSARPKQIKIGQTAIEAGQSS